MSELIKRLQAMKVGDALDWKKIRLEIHAEHERATAEAQRVALLETHRIIMDLVEKGDGIAPENLEAFRETRLKDYRLLLVREALIGQNVCVEMMHAVTEREVAAGRMASDDELRQTAVKFMAEPHQSRDGLIEEDCRHREKEARKRTGWRGVIGRVIGR